MRNPNSSQDSFAGGGEYVRGDGNRMMGVGMGGVRGMELDWIGYTPPSSYLTNTPRPKQSA